MKNINNNLRFLKFTFLRSSTMKLSAVYCFCSFVLVHSAEWIWMEEAVFKSLSAFVIVTSVLPSAVLLYLPILKTCQNSSLMVGIGKTSYQRKVGRILWDISGIFVLYYGIGTYLLSKCFFTEGHWLNKENSLLVWGLELLMLVIFLCFISDMFLICGTKNVNFAVTIACAFLTSYIFWRKIDFIGISTYDIFFGGAVLLMTYVFTEGFFKRSDFIYWR